MTVDKFWGKLSLDVFPHDPIVLTTGVFVAIGAIITLFLITYFKKWGYLWNEWLTTVDHKKLGIMYIIGALVMFVRGLADAFLMRTHLVATGSDMGFLDPHHYDQIFTAHGVIMIFFMAMPFMSGLVNFALPLQLGARDMAYPFLNAISFWFFVAGAVLINLSLFVGEFATTGWVAYPPLAGLQYSPGVGVDYYIWAIQISGIGSLLSGINFFATIIKMRTPGMTMMKMPIFSWSIFVASILIMLTFPVLTATLGMLTLDRYIDTHFFTSDFGGNPMMYINLIWIWGHPEVYILVIPAFGIFSEIAATFCRKRLFGYSTMIWAMVAITFLSFVVWLHHFFTMGAGPNVNAAFGIATMIIAIPTGVKIFNWLLTMHKAKINLSSPMLWLIAFMITFIFGGMTGVMLSIPASDFQLHNSLFLVAHFHNTIIGGVVFAYIAGFVYWWPKAFGFKLNETIGKMAVFSWLIGFFVAFTPIYILGFMGATRRMSSYAVEEWQLYFGIAFVGTLIIGLGFALQVLQILVSIINRKKYKVDGDPWNARTLEWSTHSTPSFYNFAKAPKVDDIDPFWEAKQRGENMYEGEYERIHMPKNTPIPFIVGCVLSTIIGFGFVFHIWWLTGLTLLAAIVTMIARSFKEDIDYYVEVDEIERIEKEKQTL